jgi:KaiC/GvpD/RAD55 family RecA-like ATPase
MDGSSVGSPDDPERGPSEAAELARSLGIRVETAQRLLDAGHATPEAVRELSSEALEQLGIDAEEREAIRSLPGATPPADADGRLVPRIDPDRIVEKWAGTVHKADRGRRRKLTPAGKGSTDVLRKWVGGDDRAMEDWIRSSEGERGGIGGTGGRTGLSRTEAIPSGGGIGAAPSSSALEREEMVVRWLTGLLDRVKSDQFDPSMMVQEMQDLQRQLYDERGKRQQLEDQVEHVKRGSIAVIKYIRTREAKDREALLQAKEEEIVALRQRVAGAEGGIAGDPVSPSPGDPSIAGLSESPNPPAEGMSREVEARLREEFSGREHEYIERETELRRRIVQLEGEVRRLSTEADQRRKGGELVAKGREPLEAELARRIEEMTGKERDLVTRENELRAKFEEIRLSAEEVERRRGPLEFKERELSAYDQQLQTRRQALDIESRRLEELRRELGATGVTKTSEAQRLEDLRHEIDKKETELRARESSLRERMQQLEGLAGRAAEAEAEQIHAENVQAVEATKVKSGIRRLDDLLFGGFPKGVQVLINGPAHTGKDVLARLFSVEGLRSGVPSIWVVTDKTHTQVREDLAGLLPGFPDAEKKGMIRYVDLYSLAVGPTTATPGVRFLSATDKTVLDQLGQTVNGYADEFKEKFGTYRLIFESVSTVTAYLDTQATFRFLQPFIGRRRIDGSVGYYVLESGMHSESDLESLEHMVDGSLNLKVEQMKTFLAVRGIGDAQARSWVGYTFTKRSLNLGSFSLEHIR